MAGVAADVHRRSRHRGPLSLCAPVPQVEQVVSPALDPAAQPAARRALSRALAAWYASRPIHVLRSDASPQEATARWLLRSIRIEPGHVVAVLSPL